MNLYLFSICPGPTRKRHLSTLIKYPVLFSILVESSSLQLEAPLAVSHQSTVRWYRLYPLKLWHHDHWLSLIPAPLPPTLRWDRSPSHKRSISTDFWSQKACRCNLVKVNTCMHTPFQPCTSIVDFTRTPLKRILYNMTYVTISTCMTEAFAIFCCLSDVSSCGASQISLPAQIHSDTPGNCCHDRVTLELCPLWIWFFCATWGQKGGRFFNIYWINYFQSLNDKFSSFLSQTLTFLCIPIGHTFRTVSSSPSSESLSCGRDQAMSSPPLPVSREGRDSSTSSPPSSATKKDSFFNISRSRSHSKTINKKDTVGDIVILRLQYFIFCLMIRIIF